MTLQHRFGQDLLPATQPLVGEGGAASASGTFSRGEVRIQSSGRHRPGGRGLTVEMERQEVSTSARSSAQVTVLDGAQAVIAVGLSIPFTEYWLALARRYANIRQAVQYRDITTGFSVRPRLIGQEVELEIMPRLAALRSDGVIEFSALSSTVRVVPGLWFDLGAAMQAHDEVSQAILTHARQGDGQNVQLWIMVE